MFAKKWQKVGVDFQLRSYVKFNALIFSLLLCQQHTGNIQRHEKLLHLFKSINEETRIERIGIGSTKNGRKGCDKGWIHFNGIHRN